MKLLTIHRHPLNISYKHQICSIASLFVLLVTILVVVLPFVLIHSLHKDTWKEELLLFEQPNVKFTYKYIFNVVLKDPTNNEEKLVSCSSFPTYNELTEPYQECEGIKYIDFDRNHDQKIDEMKFGFKFNRNENFLLQSLSLMIFFDATVENQCRFIIPTVVSVEKTFSVSEIQENHLPTSLSYKGNLAVTQQRSLVCPFFLRNIKSHFYYNLLHENSTRITDYSIDSVKEKLEMNPVYFKFNEENARINHHSDQIEMTLGIGEMMLRYNFTLWQVVNRIWIQYVAVFVVFYIFGEKIKDYLFRNQYIVAWEVIPWKKLR